METLVNNQTEKKVLSMNELESIMILGHLAGRKGDIAESLKCYKKGLLLSIEIDDKKKVKEFSAMIMLTI